MPDHIPAGHQKKLSKFYDDLTEIRDHIEDLLGTLRDKAEALRERYDNASEKWQENENGAAHLEKTEDFEAVVNDLEEAHSYLESSIDALANTFNAE